MNATVEDSDYEALWDAWAEGEERAGREAEAARQAQAKKDDEA